MSEPVITAANGFVLPDNLGMKRNFTRPPERLTPHYLENYDRDTLYYDCVYRTDLNAHVFTAPAFLNLWDTFRKGLRRDGQAVRKMRRRTFVKSEQVIVPSPRGALSLAVGDETFPIRPRSGLSAQFSGLNCVVVLNKNNRLDWIADWARFYVRVHGLQGVMLFDNASTEYAPEDVAETLAGVPGLERVAVMSVPFKYGPVDGGNKLQRPNFLQPSVLNLARVDAFAQARAVLNVDIDEMIRPLQNITVFDAAVARRNSMVKIHGSWIYPDPDHPLPARQKDHTSRAVPNKRCNQKWCVAPRGLLSFFGWSTHHVGGELVRLVNKDTRFELLHCRGTSTGWKSKRFNFPPLAKDAEMAAFVNQSLAESV